MRFLKKCRNTARGDMLDVEVGIESSGASSRCHARIHRHTPTMTKKLVIVGAGPVGCLAAIALANMGWVVEIYEARPGILSLPSSPLFDIFINNQTRCAFSFFASSRPTTID
jgi:NADPH-dependent 2,4-dienoyl-CoA reductase/sulfur reductase-like enzyme